ncbi:MAG TPA: FAD-binding protein [Solirubrobacteraceae bacterium]|jgi:hypothetical protein|nr:FAD-binding protein [Solirubrobacteraceae bacterium]
MSGPPDVGAETEVERLRARVAELEAELAAQAQATVALLSQAQERLYWLERWGVDLDRVMRHRAARWTLASLRAVRRAGWRLKRARRRVARRLRG